MNSSSGRGEGGGCSSYLLAPVQTIFPELNMRAVVLGSRILITTAANLYTQKPKGQLASARDNTVPVEKLRWDENSLE